MAEFRPVDSTVLAYFTCKNVKPMYKTLLINIKYTPSIALVLPGKNLKNPRKLFFLKMIVWSLKESELDSGKIGIESGEEE